MAAKDDIITALNNEGFTVPSSESSLTRLFITGVGAIQDEFLSILASDKVEIEELATSKKIGTLKWYAETAKDWQNGYNLDVDEEGNVYYATIDEAAKIIEYSSAVETAQNAVQLKVAKDDGSGEPEALTATEQAAFSGYIENIKMAGNVVTIYSINADEVKYNITVTSDGRFSDEDLTDNIETALDTFRKSIPFDGVLRASDFINAIEGVSGVVSVDLSNISTNLLTWGTDGSGAPNAVQNTQVLEAGYFVYLNTSTITIV